MFPQPKLFRILVILIVARYDLYAPHLFALLMELADRPVENFDIELTCWTLMLVTQVQRMVCCCCVDVVVVLLLCGCGCGIVVVWLM